MVDAHVPWTWCLSRKGAMGTMDGTGVPSPKLTANAPETPKRKRLSSNHPFSGDMLVSGRVSKIPS